MRVYCFQYQKTTICLRGGWGVLSSLVPSEHARIQYALMTDSPVLSTVTRDQGLSFRGQWGALAGQGLLEEDTLTLEPSLKGGTGSLNSTAQCHSPVEG